MTSCADEKITRQSNAAAETVPAVSSLNVFDTPNVIYVCGQQNERQVKPSLDEGTVDGFQVGGRELLPGI